MITLTKTYKPDLSPIADDYKWVYANLVIGTDTYVFRTSCHEDMTDAQIQAWLEKKHDDFVAEVTKAIAEKGEWKDSHYRMLATKNQAVADNLPSWAAVEAAIDVCDSWPKLRVIVKKLARVVYWMAVGKAE